MTFVEGLVASPADDAAAAELAHRVHAGRHQPASIDQLSPAERRLFAAFSDQLRAEIATLPEKFGASLWAEIGTHGEEYALNVAQGAASAQTVNVDACSSELFRVEAILISIPTGATGVAIQLKEFQIPNVPVGITQWLGLSILLGPSDVRQLTGTWTGKASVLMMGRVLPARGKVSQ